MKNKFLLLSLVVLTTFSMSSCTKREKKISVSAGNEILTTADKATNVYYANLKTKDFVSAIANGNVKGKNNYTISYPADEDKEEINQKLEFDINFDYKGNHDVKGIKANPSSLANTNAYLSTNYTINKNDIVDKTHLNIKQQGTSLSIYEQHLEDAPENKTYTLNAKDVEEYSNTFIYLFDEFSEDEVIKFLIPGLSNVDYQRIKLQYQKLNNGEIDAQGFVDYVDFYVFSNKLFEDLPEGTYECSIKLLENKNDILPSNFFDYTKISDKTSTTLKAVFDYKEWGLSIANTLSKINKELKEENSSFEMIDTIQNIFIKNLPDNFYFDYSITLDENNIINSGTVNFVTSGSIENFPDAINKIIPELENSKVEYDIELSLNLSCILSENQIEITTEEETK